MTTADVLPSVVLAAAGMRLRSKGHFARAVDKYSAAAAAAAQELAAAADDCLVVAKLRVLQADSLFCHSMVPDLPDADKSAACHTACVVLSPCITTLTRRKAAGTLLPGSCRAAEEAWSHAYQTQMDCGEGLPAVVARGLAESVAQAEGYETYLLAGGVAANVLLYVFPVLPGELLLPYAAFIASALDLLAQPRVLPVVMGFTLLSLSEQLLVENVRLVLRDDHAFAFSRDGAAAALVRDAWRRVERSGVLEQRGLTGEPDPSECIAAGIDAAAAEGAARGLHACALAGCGAREVHPAQFKKCAACQQAFYCCKAHQEQHWPAHKAACKAARKAAAEGGTGPSSAA
jgi:hypothetical protein